MLLSISFAAILFSTLQFEVLPQSLFAKLGDYRYGIYLRHVPVIVIVPTLWTQYAGRIDTLARAFVLATALILGWNFGKPDVRLHGWFKQQSKIKRFIHP